MKDDANYRQVLDHGFVYLVDTMGHDAAIVQAARVSYGAGTKSVNEDRGLIRYLVRNHHSTPFEMCEVKFHLKMPIFVARQWLRHRTASVNEISFRYSEMSDEFYLPESDHIQPQTKDNKQGRSGEVSAVSAKGVKWLMNSVYDTADQVYRILLGDREGKDGTGGDLYCDPYDESSPLLDDDFPGIARELARIVMPLASYTEFYWKMNLGNLLKFLYLRTDPHAQYEIRVYADAILDLVKPIFPLTMEAAEDYIFKAKTMSRMDLLLIQKAIAHPNGMVGVEADYGSEKDAATGFGMSLREYREIKERLTDAK